MVLPHTLGDEHVLEAIGRCRIVVRNGAVVEVGPPLIRDCPLARRFSIPVRSFTAEAVKANIEGRIAAFGMCTPERGVEEEQDFVTFGASELISCGIRHGLIDAAILTCDGAGTVLATTDRMVQGIGGRMSGLLRTSPIPDVIRRIEEGGGKVLDPLTARIDQSAGVSLARSRGCLRVAVTVAAAEEAVRIRVADPKSLIFGVHTTGISRQDAETMVANADLVTACASRHIRDVAGSVALLQAGTSIPVFAITPRGKDLVLEKLRETGQSLLVKAGNLPVETRHGPFPLV